MRRALTILALALTTACMAPRYARLPAGAAVDALVDVPMSISGMSCPIRCPLEVRDQLLAVPGVESAAVSFDEKAATCGVVAGTELGTLEDGLSWPYSGDVVD